MSYKFDTFVNRNEADALKEMIFKRARERAASMSEEIQSDVMDMARTSFVSTNNPFSKIIEKSAPAAAVEPTVSKEEETVQTDSEKEIGFPQRAAGTRIAAQSRLIDEQIAGAAVQNTMMEARAGLSSKSSFMGALNFLNSQAAISLIKTRADKFEIIA